MISDWRAKMELALPFYFVQLAAYGADYSLIRQAQMAALKLKDVGYALAIDIGDPTSPFGSIHPRRKQEVGRRLSLSALEIQYGGAADSMFGPQVTTIAKRQGDGIDVSFKTTTAASLHSAGTAACTKCCNESPFQVSTANGTFVRVPFTLSGSTASLSGTSAWDGKVVRYAFEGYPQCSLCEFRVGEGGGGGDMEKDRKREKEREREKKETHATPLLLFPWRSTDNGVGGPDDHTGIAATPFCRNFTRASGECDL